MGVTSWEKRRQARLAMLEFSQSVANLSQWQSGARQRARRHNRLKQHLEETPHRERCLENRRERRTAVTATYAMTGRGFRFVSLCGPCQRTVADINVERRGGMMTIGERRKKQEELCAAWESGVNNRIARAEAGRGGSSGNQSLGVFDGQGTRIVRELSRARRGRRLALVAATPRSRRSRWRRRSARPGSSWVRKRAK